MCSLLRLTEDEDFSLAETMLSCVDISTRCAADDDGRPEVRPGSEHHQHCSVSMCTVTEGEVETAPGQIRVGISPRP